MAWTNVYRLLRGERAGVTRAGAELLRCCSVFTAGDIHTVEDILPRGFFCPVLYQIPPPIGLGQTIPLETTDYAVHPVLRFKDLLQGRKRATSRLKHSEHR